MAKGRILTTDKEIKEVLDNSKSIAVLGMSSNEERDSYMVSKYLINNDYDVLPVRPGADEILGQKVYPDLDSVDKTIDIVDVFRRSDQVMGHVEEVLRLKPKYFWMQLGIKNDEAVKKLIDNGINVITDRCIKVEHKRLCR